MAIPLEVLLIHAAGGFLGGVLALLLVPPDAEEPNTTHPARQAVVRLVSSVLAAVLFSGQALQVLPWEMVGFWPQIAVSGALGLLAWWGLHAVVLVLRKRRGRDALEILKDIKNGGDDVRRD
jgi:transposase